MDSSTIDSKAAGSSTLIVRAVRSGEVARRRSMRNAVHQVRTKPRPLTRASRCSVVSVEQGKMSFFST